MRKRRLIAVTAVGLVTAACGLGVVGSFGEGLGADGGGPNARDGQALDGPGPQPLDSNPTFPFDGGAFDASDLDVNPANCAAACTGAGRGCDGGWCVVACDPNGSCTTNVACPAG